MQSPLTGSFQIHERVKVPFCCKNRKNPTRGARQETTDKALAPFLPSRKRIESALQNHSAQIGSTRAPAVQLFSPSHMLVAKQTIRSNLEIRSLQLTVCIEDGFVYKADNTTAIHINRTSIANQPLQRFTAGFSVTPFWQSSSEADSTIFIESSETNKSEKTIISERSL